MVVTMATYINSLINLGPNLIIQLPQPFDPNSAESQQLMKQMQRGKLLSDAVVSWVNNILEQGNKFISEITSIYSEGEALLGEIQTLIPVWETELSRCQTIVSRVTEVEKFGVLKFLGENPMKAVDPCTLFILKSNMSWKESIYKEAIKEVQGVKNQITDMHKELVKDMNIVNPTGILQLDEGSMDIEVLTKSFTEAVEQIRDKETPKVNDFTSLAGIESMLRLNEKLMPCQSLKMKEYRWQKDACRARLMSLKNPHSQATQEFMSTFQSWKLVRQTVGNEEEAGEYSGN
ncbi:hypothetical protein SUGI_0048610 [Cryptomeria japonica]|nr:hypothetical protein SUGI_0048610 [Cryptomeria japonica]